MLWCEKVGQLVSQKESASTCLWSFLEHSSHHAHRFLSTYCGRIIGIARLVRIVPTCAFRHHTPGQLSFARIIPTSCWLYCTTGIYKKGVRISSCLSVLLASVTVFAWRASSQTTLKTSTLTAKWVKVPLHQWTKTSILRLRQNCKSSTKSGSK